MKVGTLACIFGAAITSSSPQFILDIGTGTGVLALMMAQRFPTSKIEALEIETNAFHQAKSNFKESPWDTRLHIECADFNNWKAKHLYDLIITNPPFFNRHLKSPGKAINLARHNDQLPMSMLINKVFNLLAASGSFWVLLPKYESDKFKVEAEQAGLFLNYQIQILNFAEQPVKAVISQFSKRKKFDRREELVIRQDDNSYNDNFIQLLKPFYLHL